jgi:hypothetical protein
VQQTLAVKPDISSKKFDVPHTIERKYITPPSVEGGVILWKEGSSEQLRGCKVSLEGSQNAVVLCTLGIFFP